MDRQPPRSASDEIDLYVRTYYSLLRSSGDVRVRAFEEAHIYSRSSLHLGAQEPVPDVAAFAYSAARLPTIMPRVRRLVLGQSHEHFEAAGLQVSSWPIVHTRGRRRPLRWDGGETLAAFISSATDIDDLVPIVTAYQVEWNKMHARFDESGLGRRIVAGELAPEQLLDDELASALGLPLVGTDGDSPVVRLKAAFGDGFAAGVLGMAARESDLSMRLLAGSYSQYQRAAHRWWSGIEPHYLREERPRRRPTYFVSSNTHSLVNLLGGAARAQRESLLAWARAKNPENLRSVIADAEASGDEHTLANLNYYLLRLFLHSPEGAGSLAAVQRADAENGIVSMENPGRIDVAAQVIELRRLQPAVLDPRLRLPGLELIAESDAVIVNIDYPLGLAAYHHLARLAQAAGEIRGIYVMGKAATLNGRVGDVMISTVAHDEHSRNSYLFRNCFAAADLAPYLREASVFDNQKALTVRGAFLQNREYMSVFYREGYTVIEMEAGPYLSAIYELVSPNRHPEDQIVHLSTLTPFDVGILHYASDTPYSRRQTLLSKSLSFFGVESTYGCAIAILRRILGTELARLRSGVP